MSEAPKVEVVKKYHSQVELDEYKTDEQRKDEVGSFVCFEMWSGDHTLTCHS